MMTAARPLNPRSIIVITGVSIFLAGILILKFARSSLSLPPGIQSNNHHIHHDDIHNRTLGFQKIFAVNLPERTDHRDALILQAAVSDIDIDFVDGVHASSVPEKVMPFVHANDQLPGVIGAWRAHMNVIAEIVRRGVTTALIFEDDVDWDVRLKDLLSSVGTMIRMVQASDSKSTLNYNDHPPPSVPRGSEYGTGWDILWLGHCGMHIPEDETKVIHYDDISVPQSHYLRSWDINEVSPMVNYPNHSRILTRPKDPTCSLGYAVSSKGARKILYDMGLERFDMAFDLMLRRFCQQPENTCFGVLPQLFNHHRSRGGAGDSDISSPNAVERQDPFTKNVRWSVRLNMQEILAGGTNWVDQYPDV